MKQNNHRFLFGLPALLLALSVGFLGCPNGNNDDPPPPPFVAVTAITGVPAKVEVNKDLTLTGTATPDNANYKDITWAVKNQGTTNATITGGKLKGTAKGTVIVTATIAKGKSETANYTQDFNITVYEEGKEPTVTGVTIDPATATVAKSGNQTFTATVTGTNEPSQDVTWSIVETTKKAGTIIDGNGKLTVAADEALTSLTVKAVSSVDNTKSKTVTVTVTGTSGGGGNQLPASKGANALSGKTYINWEEKIVFSITAEGTATGTYTKRAVQYDSNSDNYLIENGKYVYIDIETGSYSWDGTAKTVTTSPEKVAIPGEDGYGSLQDKAGYRASMQTMLDQYKQQMGETAFNQALASQGFSSVAAYLDDAVADAFKNAPYNYAFSTDNKVLFLDEPLPANKGSNELTGQTFYGMTWNNGSGTKDTNQTYKFTATDCTYTYDNYPQTYTYAYDSTEKRVYLKTPTSDRESNYDAQVSNNTTDSGNFASADEYNAAQVNSSYRLNRYKYDTATKTLERR